METIEKSRKNQEDLMSFLHMEGKSNTFKLELSRLHTSNLAYSQVGATSVESRK